MKSTLLVVLLAAAATAAVVSNEVPDVADGNEMAVLDIKEVPEASVTDVVELIEADELIDDDEELQTAVDSRRNLGQGAIGARDVRIHNREYRANGVAGRIQERTITVTANNNRRITAIRITRQGNSQNATPSIIGGGVEGWSVTILIRSAVGRGYHYRVEVYAR